VAKINEKKINYLLMQQSLPYQRAASKKLIKAFNELKDEELNSPIIPEKYDERIVKNRVMQEKVQQLASNSKVESVVKQQIPDVFSMNKDLMIYNRTMKNVHIFYYHNIKWFKDDDSKIFNTAFHPKIGFYNHSMDIMRAHFHDIRLCGVGVIIFNWHPKNPELNDNFDRILDMVNENYTNPNNSIKLAIQIDDYQDRTIESIRNNIKFVVDNFSANQNFYKVYSTKRHRLLPIFYIKNAFNIKELDWAKLLSKNGILTIRNTMYDALIIAHIEYVYLFGVQFLNVINFAYLLQKGIS
jgi:glycoprotein endo-alpha-1,2-mannosidase